MKSKWRVACNPIGNENLYIVYRLKDVNEVNHSGNHEYATDYMTSKQEAQAIADELNSEEIER